MEQIGNLLNKSATGGSSERSSIISMFIDEINKERVGTRWKPLSKINITRLCIDINRHPQLKSNQQLYEFLSLCKESKGNGGSFGAKCFGTLRVKK